MIQNKNAKNRSEVEFWQSRVKITQIPSHLEIQVVINPKTITHKSVEIERSWLFDPFLDQTVYGLEITLNRGFSWVFYMVSDSRAEALRRGYSLMMHLEEKFPGITGEVNALPIYSHILNQNPPIFELILPKAVYLEKDKFSIIKKIARLFRAKNEDNFIQFFLIWQRDDSVDRIKLGKISPFDLFKIKIFVRVKVNRGSEKDQEREIAKIKGLLDYLTLNINNILGERASLKKIKHNKLENILANTVFWVNYSNEHTGLYYSYIKAQLPAEKIPAFISPNQVDFTFLKDIPIQKTFLLPTENVNYLPISKEDPNYITLGNVVNKGVITNNIKRLPIAHFAHSVFIGGQPETGKTSLLREICEEFYNKAPHIGLLILNLGKGKQEGLFKTDIVLKFGSPELRIPYYFGGEYPDKSRQETASYMTASLGLRNPCDKITYNVMNAFIKVNGELPTSLKTLFRGVMKWFEEYKYSKKFQTNILRALQNRVFTLLSQPILAKTLELPSDYRIPKWFLEWRKGKTVFIDLSMCNIWVKRLLSFAIFQMVKSLIPDMDVESLQNIIVMDEVHQLTEKSTIIDSNDDDFISRAQMELILNTLIREFRSKGLSFILIDHTPHRQFSCVTAFSSLKILFRLGHLDNELFTNNRSIQEYLTLQKNRHALILNGNNEEILVIRTTDYSS